MSPLIISLIASTVFSLGVGVWNLYKQHNNNKATRRIDSTLQSLLPAIHDIAKNILAQHPEVGPVLATEVAAVLNNRGIHTTPEIVSVVLQTFSDLAVQSQTQPQTK